MSWADTIVCGPGIGTTDAAAGMVRTVIKNAAVPVLLDADALNVIAKDTNLLLLPHHGTRGDAAPWRDEPADGGFGGVSAESSD